MAVYTYDEEADALYVLVVTQDDAAIRRTVAVSDRVHVDLDESDRVVGVEILNPTDGDNGLASVREQFGIEVKLPFRFAA